MFAIEYNFKKKYHTGTNLLCPICAASDENLQHTATCSLNSYNKSYSIKSSNYVYGSDGKKTKNWTKFLMKYEKFKEYLKGNIK